MNKAFRILVLIGVASAVDRLLQSVYRDTMKHF